MNCSVCKNAFIISETYEEYNEKRREFEDKITKIIDEMTEEELSRNYNDMWNKMLNREALHLTPNRVPKKCHNEKCAEYICDFCYYIKEKCSWCKKFRSQETQFNFTHLSSECNN